MGWAPPLAQLAEQSAVPGWYGRSDARDLNGGEQLGPPIWYSPSMPLQTASMSSIMNNISHRVDSWSASFALPMVLPVNVALSLAGEDRDDRNS